MQIKTSELIGTQLDWAVAQCEGKKHGYAEHLLDIEDLDLVSGVAHSMIQRYSPSSNPAQSYPIIDRGMIAVKPAENEGWEAYVWPNHSTLWGDTPLIAAMRAYATFKLGAYVEIPDDLNQTQPAP